MNYFHIDVFSSKPLSGNGLTVVFPDKELESAHMQEITREFNQFETIFLYPLNDNNYRARIFTVDEELNFAGHPVLGASAAIFNINGKKDKEQNINIVVNNRTIETKVKMEGKNIFVEMNQGKPEFISTLKAGNIKEIISALNLDIFDIHTEYPVEVVSTGLPYLLLPLKDFNILGKAEIISGDFEKLLEKTGAKFIYVFEPAEIECRTWDNTGRVEDVATGSAAGPLGAYLVKNGFKSVNEEIVISQGRFVHRQSQIYCSVDGETNEVSIKGPVAFFAHGAVLHDFLP